jgi:hypothetical protein
MPEMIVSSLIVLAGMFLVYAEELKQGYMVKRQDASLS